MKSLLIYKVEHLEYQIVTVTKLISPYKKSLNQVEIALKTNDRAYYY